MDVRIMVSHIQSIMAKVIGNVLVGAIRVSPLTVATLVQKDHSHLSQLGQHRDSHVHLLTAICQFL